MDRKKTQNTGRLGEQIAYWYLKLKGYHILSKNFRVKGGEIDIVCRRAQTLVFVEVKTRTSVAGGNPEEAVTADKLARIQTAIDTYLLTNHNTYDALRLDVISIIIKPQAIPRICHWRNISLNT